VEVGAIIDLPRSYISEPATRQLRWSALSAARWAGL